MADVDDAISWPFLSVILPIRNEGNVIARTLDAVLSQDYPPQLLEILVADGRSDDDTRAIISEYSRRDARVKLVDNSEKIMAAGFNAALQEARGDAIVMLGGHTQIAPGFLREGARVLAEGRADCVGGPIETIATTPEARAISLAMSSRFGVGGVAFRIGAQEEIYVDTVAFGAYTREIIERAGPLDAELVRNQDDEYNHRLRKLGARILLTPKIRARYSSRATLRALWKQYFDYGFWKVRVMQKHPRQMKPRHFAPPLFAALWIALIALAPFSKKLRRVLAGFALLYGGAIVAASAAAWRDARAEDAQEKPAAIFADETPPVNVKTALHLPPAFAILHFSYGLGFLVGLIKFARRWRDN